MTRTERLDFVILFFSFGILIAGTSSFSVFIAQIFVRILLIHDPAFSLRHRPYYSNHTATHQ